MKCKALTEWRISKQAEAYREYGIIAIEWIDCTFGVALADLYGFREARLGRFYSGQREYLENLVERYSYDHGIVYDERTKRMREEAEYERVTDSLLSAQTRMASILREAGFRDPEIRELFPEDSAVRWKPKRQEMTEVVRRAWFDFCGKRATEAYAAASLCHIRETEGFGAARLGWVYDVIRESLRSFFEMFFTGSVSADRQINREIERMHARLMDCGVELERIETESVQFIRRIQPRSPGKEELMEIERAANDAPEEYRKILAQVRGRKI